MKLLIADDEQIIREGLLTMEWDSIGVRICGAAKNGVEALELLNRKKPDIFLSDIRMPGLDGLELARAIQERMPQCAVIFLSGYNDFDYVRQALRLGVFDYILKPTSPEEIFDCVKRAAEHQNKNRAERLSKAQTEESLKQAQLQVTRSEAAEEDVEDEGHTRTMGASVGLLLQYLEEHHHEELTLKEIERVFHFNPIYINRVLKKETGHTFLEILNTIRLEHAERLLKGSDMKIARIAGRVGLSNQRYFSQVFKKAYGITPLKYRQMAHDGEEPQSGPDPSKGSHHE